MSKPLPVAVVVLAAGQGSRMGGGKLLLPLDDKTVIERTVQSFQDAQVADIIVVVGNYALAVQYALRNYPVRFAFNPDSQSEMIDSIRCGLRALDLKGVDAFLVTPADMPLIRPETIRHIVTALLRSDKSIAVPTYLGRRGHPVAFHASLYETVLNFQSPQGIRPLVHGQMEQVMLLEVDDEGIVMDVDSWDDYRKALHWTKREGKV